MSCGTNANCDCNNLPISEVLFSVLGGTLAETCIYAKSNESLQRLIHFRLGDINKNHILNILFVKKGRNVCLLTLKRNKISVYIYLSISFKSHS